MHKCLLLICLLGSINAFAQTVDVFTAVKNGGWNDPTTWGSSTPPQPSQPGNKVKVIIPSGISVNTLDITSPSPQEMITQIDTIDIFGTLTLGNPNASPTIDFFFDYPVYIMIESGGKLVDSTTASTRYGIPSDTPRHVIALQKGATTADSSTIIIKPNGQFVGQCSDPNYPGTYVYACSGGYSTGIYNYYNYVNICSLSLNPNKINYISTHSSGSITLPVILTSFNGYYQQNLGVVLEWTTSSEYNSSYFAIERSNDGQVFTQIGQVQAMGNSQIPHNYSFTDISVLKDFLPVYYYRLRQVDLDGRFTYSPVIAIHLPTEPGGNPMLWPNPNAGSFTLHVPITNGQQALVRIMNLLGQVVEQLQINSPTSTVQVRHPSPGVYWVEVQYANGTHKTLQMLIIR
ncbi:MAG: T9SS type A sorting domain-containing protein [Thermoflavifilum sp.]|nr:T9SS type A sorting domain-containing protein [Thermoflavifilum sp.]